LFNPLHYFCPAIAFNHEGSATGLQVWNPILEHESGKLANTFNAIFYLAERREIPFCPMAEHLLPLGVVVAPFAVNQIKNEQLQVIACNCMDFALLFVNQDRPAFTEYGFELAVCRI
jgi:hypothetical protein